MMNTKTKIRPTDIEGFPLPGSAFIGKIWGVDANGNFAWVDPVKGDKGDIGAKPDHLWSGTSLSFELPDGSYGVAIDLKGEKGNAGPPGPRGLKGDKGDPGDMLGPSISVDGNIAVFDGVSGKALKDAGVSPAGLQATVNTLKTQTEASLQASQAATQAALTKAQSDLNAAIAVANASVTQALANGVQKGFQIIETVTGAAVFSKGGYLVAGDLSIASGDSLIVAPDVVAEVTGVALTASAQDLTHVASDASLSANAVFLPVVTVFDGATLTIPANKTLYGSDSRIYVY